MSSGPTAAFIAFSGVLSGHTWCRANEVADACPTKRHGLHSAAYSNWVYSDDSERRITRPPHKYNPGFIRLGRYHDSLPAHTLPETSEEKMHSNL